MILISLISSLVIAAAVLVAIAMILAAAIFLNAWGDPGFMKATKRFSKSN